MTDAQVLCVAPGDADVDGCTDVQEQQPKANASAGGGRDPLSFWDFFDTETENGRNAGTHLAGDVSINDILNIVLRFALTGDPAIIDALSDAKAMTYHTRYDRGGPIPGQNAWNLRPPNGSIDISDILAAVFQFGDNC